MSRSAALRAVDAGVSTERRRLAAALHRLATTLQDRRAVDALRALRRSLLSPPLELAPRPELDGPPTVRTPFSQRGTGRIY